MKLLNKTLIAVAAISSTIGVTFLGAWSFSRQSEQILGAENQTSLNLTDFFTAGGDFVAFVAPADQEKSLGTYESTTNKVSYKGEHLDFEVFFNKFIKEHDGATPIMRISKGGFNFHNEYLEAVGPKDFVEYVDWFVENVAWGPEALTLKSFSIVRNISRNGNSVTLGGHETKDKENKLIKFYPDSFFGSLPMFDQTSGQSNGQDRLLNPLNSTLISKSELDQYLNNVGTFNTIANDLTAANKRVSFRNLAYAHLLKGKKVFHINTSSGKTMLIDAATKREAFAKVIAYNQTQSMPQNRIEQNYNLLTESTITEVNLQGGALNVRYGENGYHQLIIAVRDFAQITQFNLDQLETVMQSGITSFRDIYNIGQYVDKKYHLYSDGVTKYPKVFQSKEKAQEDLGVKFEEAKLQELILSKVSVEKQKLTLTFIDENKKVVHNLQFDGADTSQEIFSFFFLLKRAFGYKSTVSPYLVRPEGDDLDLETGQTSQFYKIYNQIYQDLIETVLYKYPYLNRLQEGEHLVRYSDENGVYRYKMETGIYHGMNISDRIPFLMLLAATNPEFKGVGIDFLKYVGAHEYGHHTTLQNIQNIGDGNTPVLLGSLNPNSSPRESQYYNANLLREYLKARTESLDFNQGNLNDPSLDGPYAFFKWTDINSKEEVTESQRDIWGSETKDATETLDNKKRRFVQDLKGLQEAANLRGMKLFELFLMNTLDNHSGTLNPQLIGPAEFLDAARKFNLPSYTKLFASLTDGLGNPIKYHETAFQDYPIDPIVIQYKSDGETVEAVKIFNKQGEPVINVKNGDKLNQEQKNLEITIKVNLLSLLRERFFSSGWNRATTNLNNKMEITADHSDGLKGSAPAISGSNRSVQYFVDWTKRYFENRDQEDADIVLSDYENSQKNNVNLYRRIFSQTNSRGETRANPLGTQLLSILANQVPYLRLDRYVLKFNSNSEQYFADQIKINLHPRDVTSSAFPNDSFDAFMRWAMPFSENSVNESPDRSYVYRLLDKDGNLIPTITPGIVNSGNIAFVAVNPERLGLRDTKANSSVFDAYLDSMIVEYQMNVTTADGVVKQKVPTLGFKKLEDWAEFASLDLTKISVGKKNVNDKETLYRNFDVNYVKTKFNIEKFITNFKAWVNSLSTSAAQKAALLEKVATEQDAANEVMERFLKSSLQFLFKNSKTAVDLTDMQAAINGEIGIRHFRKAEILFTDNPNRNQNEMNAKDVYDAIQQYLTDNNIQVINGVDKQNHQLTTLDVLLMMGRIRFSIKKTDTAKEYEEGGGVLGDLIEIYFKDWGPSSDVTNYIETPSETRLSEIFSDYTYTIPEALTRDFIQITYNPGLSDFRTLPSYVQGANESNTGYEFYLTASETQIWEDSKINLNGAHDIIRNFIWSYSNEIVNRNKIFIDTKWIDINVDIKKLQDEIAALEKEKLTFAEAKKQEHKETTTNIEKLKQQLVESSRNLEGLTTLTQGLVKENGVWKIIDDSLKLATQFDNNALTLQRNLATQKNDIELLEMSIGRIQAIINNSASLEEVVKAAQTQLATEQAKLVRAKEVVTSTEMSIINAKATAEKLRADSVFYANITDEQATALITQYAPQIELLKQITDGLTKAIETLEKSLKTLIDDPIKANAAEVDKKISDLQARITTLSQNVIDELPESDLEKVNPLGRRQTYEFWTRTNSSFFGKVNSLNNGYFFDRWLRSELNWDIYDKEGNSVHDETLRITGLNGEKITDRARATWMYLLKSKGVSLGTLTGSWRDKDRDANVFWGYVPTALGAKIKYLTFEDEITGRKFHIEINTKNTNNLFYFKKAADESSKVTLADEGYVSWATNFAFIAKYKNAFLTPGNTYKVYFTDEIFSLVEGFSLIEGTKVLGENNKTIAQSPTYFFKKEGDDKNVFFYVQNQFNI